MRLGKIVASLILISPACVLAGERMHIAWPQQWEMRPPVRDGAVLRLHAREHDNATTVQLLELTAIDTRNARRLLVPYHIHQVASELRDVALRSATETDIDLISLGKSHGYYFIATDRNYRGADGEYRQMVEGVMLKSGYLINFTLLTNDANSAESRNMMSALSELQIE